MWAPGAVGLTVGVLLLLAVRDSPEQCGYPPVEIVTPKAKVRHPSRPLVTVDYLLGLGLALAQKGSMRPCFISGAETTAYIKARVAQPNGPALYL
jgi:hypothetical protein